jgi:hypothetical protein
MNIAENIEGVMGPEPRKTVHGSRVGHHPSYASPDNGKASLGEHLAVFVAPFRVSHPSPTREPRVDAYRSTADPSTTWGSSQTAVGQGLRDANNPGQLYGGGPVSFYSDSLQASVIFTSRPLLLAFD